MYKAWPSYLSFDHGNNIKKTIFALIRFNQNYQTFSISIKKSHQNIRLCSKSVGSKTP